jgi:hypothetical protein
MSTLGRRHNEEDTRIEWKRRQCNRKVKNKKEKIENNRRKYHFGFRVLPRDVCVEGAAALADLVALGTRNRRAGWC